MLAYLRLFRWPNLLVVALTQYLFRYAVILPVLNFYEIDPVFTHLDFFLLVMATLLLTAAGYAINDYFDLRIDRINKPQKIILGKKISRRHAIFSHSLLNVLGVVVAAYLAIRVNQWTLVFIFLIISLLLWMYSIKYKRKFFIGNFIVSLLSAFVVAVVWVFEVHALESLGRMDDALLNTMDYLVKAYAMFAFLTSLSREIVKDMEDIKGDQKTGCKTIPIVWGVSATQKLVMVLALVIMALVAYFQFYVFQPRLYWVSLYFLLGVQLPFAWVVIRAARAREKQHYSNLSKLIKLVMIAGVASMWLVYYYVTCKDILTMP